jgi:hypothetical protein
MVIGLPASKQNPARLPTIPEENVAVVPSQVTVLLQTIVNGESGDKQKEIPTPSTVKEALEGPHATEWLFATVKELHGLSLTGTYEEV